MSSSLYSAAAQAANPFDNIVQQYGYFTPMAASVAPSAPEAPPKPTWDSYDGARHEIQEYMNRIAVEKYGEMYSVEVKYHPDHKGRWAAYFVLKLADYGPVVHFNLCQYEACCAMYQINNFRYVGMKQCDQEMVSWFFDLAMEACRRRSLQCTRVVLNLVESVRAYDNDNEYRNPTNVVKPIKNPNMKYPFVYNWCKSKGKHQEMLFTNHNTGNIIHFTEVVL